MPNNEYHEPLEELSQADRDLHRALKSLQEELEAVDWYHQRASRCKDPDLKKIILHNRDEEMEHASMLLEWLRKNMGGWDSYLRTHLYKEETGSAPGTDLTDLRIGNLKGERRTS